MQQLRSGTVLQSKKLVTCPFHNRRKIHIYRISCVCNLINHVFKENGRGKPRVLRMSSPPNPAVNLATPSMQQSEVRSSVN